MDADKLYVRTDEHGAMRVGDTGVMLDAVVAAWALGHSPESIRAQYPSLSLEQVYGAITYCLAHPQEVDGYLARQEGLWKQLRAEGEARSGAVVERLRAIRRSGEAVAG